MWLTLQIQTDTIDFTHIHPSIQHLSQEDIVELIRQYYAGFPIKELKTKFKIKFTPPLNRLFPEKITNKKCPYCDVSYKENWHPKSGDPDSPYCPSCNHQDFHSCLCKNCLQKSYEKFQEEEQKNKKLIREIHHEKNYKRLKEKDLTLENKLYLAVLLRGGLTESLIQIKPLLNITQSLTPTSDWNLELIISLASKGIIVPHWDSDPSAFVDLEKSPHMYVHDEVIFRLNLEAYDDNYYNMLERLLYPSAEQFESNSTFCFDMWKKISLNESLEYLLYSLDKVGFDFNPGKKTIKVLENLLRHYSVSQIYCLIHGAVAKGTKLFQEKKLSRSHAANTVITYCESLGERALAEGWKITKFRRNYDLPESLLSRIFFTSILNIADLGFDEKPSHI